MKFYRCVASNPAGEVKSECELKVRPAVTTTQLTDLTTAVPGQAPPIDSVQADITQQPPLADQTTVTSEMSQVTSQDNAQWQETVKQTVTIQKTNESSNHYAVPSSEHDATV